MTVLKKTFFTFLLTSLLITPIIFSGCKDNNGGNPDPIDSNNNGFETRDVATVFITKCATSGCHAGAHPTGGISFETYDRMMQGSAGRHIHGDTTTGGGGHGHGKIRAVQLGAGPYGGEAVIPFNADESLVYRLITTHVKDSSLRMPYNRMALNDAEILTVKNWINTGARNNAGVVPSSNPSIKAYICSQATDQIFVIDGDKKYTSRVINLGSGGGANTVSPHNAKIYGDYFYVTQIKSGKLVKFRISDNSAAGEVTGLEVPGMIELSPDGKRAFVSKSSTATGSYNVIYVINTETMQLVSELTIPVAGIPHGIALNSDASKIYIANMTKDRISILNTATGDPDGDDIVMSSTGTTVYEPMHMYVSPDDKYIYVSCRKTNKLLVYDAVTHTIIKEIEFTSHPMQISITPGGNKLYVNLMGANKVAVVQKTGTDWAISSFIESLAFSMPYGSAISADGQYVYVTNCNQMNAYEPHYAVPGRLQSSNVIIISTATNEVVRILDMGAYATGLAVR